MKESILTGFGVELFIEKQIVKAGVEIKITHNKEVACTLHWGVSTPLREEWVLPPETLWPQGTSIFQASALQTPFSASGAKSISIYFDSSSGYHALHFALFFPGENRWDNNGGQNYSIAIPVPGRKFSTPSLFLERKSGETLFEQEYQTGCYRLAVRVCSQGEILTLYFATTIQGKLYLHWGAARTGSRKWFLPAEKSEKGSQSVAVGGNALQTEFIWDEGFNQLHIELCKGEEFSGVYFLLKTPEPERWIKNQGRDFYAALRSRAESQSLFDTPQLADMAQAIVAAETNHNSWTLMHRFDLCFTLMDEVRSRKALALIFVWLRFSAIRQLDWQRNYNTQPRALAHSQDRLTLKIAGAYRGDSENRDLLRLILTTLGPGGEGQKIRDEILHIMHRHNIKEVSGHFMEEWHQKLHNNTTPDDIAICKAYIAFLKSDGNQDVFYDTLKKGGVDRERLAGFERPIVTPPDFVPHLKHALIHDFGNYLKLFNSVHAGNDLEVAIENVRGSVDNGMNELLSSVWHCRMDGPLLHRVGLVTDARKGIAELLDHEHDRARLRSLLYLDLALEELIRKIVEGNIHLGLKRDELIHLVRLSFENISLKHRDEEFKATLLHWRSLSEKIVDNREWALHAKSVLDRISRITAEYLDGYYSLFQPVAENLGPGFNAGEWSINCFSEEILRGDLAFVLFTLIHHLDPVLRESADLGEWQIVSRGEAEGYLRFYKTLRSVQGKKFDLPTVLLVNEVKGDEDIPEGVTAVITPDSVDLVSHVAVRVRNAGVLFATCYSDSILSDLKSRQNSFVGARVSGSGDVTIDSVSENLSAGRTVQAKSRRYYTARRGFSAYALSIKEVTSDFAGGKSLHLRELGEGTPQWIGTPKSVVIPFGVFERVLEEQSLYTSYNKLLARLDLKNPDTALSDLARFVTDLPLHDGIISFTREKMVEAGFSGTSDPESLWNSIKGVWASVWSKMAFESRRTFGFPHDAISMAVLVQEVICAEYAFVIHTVNPLTGRSDELFFEVVSGLGETLVGSHPGRAFGFTSSKDRKEFQILSFPSKSYSLRGEGVICRSDSNAEDLGSYSGAGVYDSILLNPPQKYLNNYLEDPLIKDTVFRGKVVQKITEIGVIVEKYFRTPQDIEGVYSQGRWYVVQTRPQAGLPDLSF